MRKEEDADFLIRYPFLNEDPVYRPASRDLFIQAQNSLAKRMRNIFLQQNEVPTFIVTRLVLNEYFKARSTKNYGLWSTKQKVLLSL